MQMIRVYKKNKGGRPKTGRVPKTCVSIKTELHSRMVAYALENQTTLIDTIERAFNFMMDNGGKA